MSLYTSRTTLIRLPGIGVLKVTPTKGRKIKIDAPEAVEITDKKGKPLDRKRVKR